MHSRRAGWWCGLAVAASAVGAAWGGVAGGQEIDPQIRKQASRAIGLDIGMKMAGDDNLDVSALQEGFLQGITRKEPLTPAEEEGMRKVVQQFNDQLSAAMTAKMESQAAKNSEAALAFLRTNGAAAGVKTLPGGVQYKVIAEGKADAPKPTKTDVVRVHYEGKLLNGTVFDSSLAGDDPQPVVFPVGRVIDGWQTALQEMKVGDKWQIWIPPSLAYGKTPPPGTKIEPESLLVFEIELLGIEKPAAPGIPGGLGGPNK